jgi:hypothetical protein
MMLIMSRRIVYKTVDDLNQDHPLHKPAESQVYKFIRIGDEYRFSLVDFHCPSHFSLFGDDEAADAAGTISISSDFWRLMRPSMIFKTGSFKLLCSNDDVERLSILLERPEQ